MSNWMSCIETYDRACDGCGVEKCVVTPALDGARSADSQDVGNGGQNFFSRKRLTFGRRPIC